MTRSHLAIALAATFAVAGGGYWIYTTFAAQGQGTLAQTPLNVDSNIPPAFIMAVDDSGSMTFETLFPANDGPGCWTGTSFFNANGTLATTGNCQFNHLIPYPGHRIDNNRWAIAPVLTYGFARSAEFNPSYFDHTQQYLPWVNSDNTPYGATVANPLGNASRTATRTNPRNTTPTIDFTRTRGETDAALMFQLRTNMVLPEETEYYATSNCGGLGTTNGTRNQWVELDDDHRMTANCTVGIRYFPAVFYLKTTTAAPAGYRTNLVGNDETGGRTLARNACGASCDMYRYEIRPENYSSSDAYNAAHQNFVNWFSFYGNRNRAMIAGMTRALVDVNNMRVGYFTINRRTATVPMRDMGEPARKAELFAELHTLPASGGTPNLFAVNHIGQQFLRTDANAPVQLACQKNAGMLFTDGYSNGGTPGAPAVSGLGEPFDPTPANSMAAIATRYYQTSLRPDLPQGLVRVPSGCGTPQNPIANPDPRLDCNRNPHMNFYGITLGANGKIFDADAPRDPFDAPYPDWEGHFDSDVRAVDDIWHAAVNTRGEFINATTPLSITRAMRRVLSSVSAEPTPAGTIDVAGARIGTNSFSVQPEYDVENNGTDWFSKLTAQSVSIDPVTKRATFVTRWEASAVLPSASTRANRTFFATTTGAARPTVRTFTATNLGARPFNTLCNNALARCSEATALALGVPAADAVAYLLGDTSRETRNSGQLRDRTTRLGDIVNSNPVVSSPTNDYGYRALRDTAGNPDPYGYAAYLTTKATRPTMVYVGANDGMLHAFDGSSGVEQFAYIPATAVGHMGNLLFPYDLDDRDDQVFQHRYYVDGPVTVSDAYLSGSWKTMLVGTAGAGGKSIFALDLANPRSFTAGDVLWELNDRVSDTNVSRNIGNILGKPVVVPVKNTAGDVAWQVVFGNGYGSTNGRAALFMVNAATGAAAVTQAQEASQTGANGLGNVIVLDRYRLVAGTWQRGRDGFADTAYAGDQFGAVWKFDLRAGAEPTKTQPLFVASDAGGGRQPILGGFEAATGPGGGVMLYFGTGAFSFNGDPADRQVQTLYAINDQGAPITGRAELQQQTILAEDVDGLRSISVNTLGLTAKGWYIDLRFGSATGERFVGYPRIESGVVFFTTFDPNSTDVCATGGKNRLYGLSALSGAAGLSRARIGAPDGASLASGIGGFNLNTPGSAPVKDVAVYAAPRESVPLGTVTQAVIDAAVNQRCDMIVQAAGAPPLYMPRPCGRQSWRQVR